MSLPPVVRVFFAIDLPEEIKQQVGNYISSLKKKSKSNSIRWSKPENLHITLQFMGSVDSNDLSEIIERVRDKISGVFKNIPIQLGALQLFPNPFKARVIVFDVLPQDVLTELSEEIGQGIEAAGYETEDRRFRAHMTLGRIKHQSVKLKFLEEVDLLDIDPITIDEVVLFRSEPTPTGSQYLPLERIGLERMALKKRA